MDRSWLISDEALVHDPDCKHQGMPMDVCNCQQEQLFRMINDRDNILKKADVFVDDVMPQIGGLCIQDYGNLNELCMGLTKWKSQNK